MFSPQRLLLFAALALHCAEATQVMHRPDGYKDQPNDFKLEKAPKTNVVHRRANGKVNFAYFTNWGIYGANFRLSLYRHWLSVFNDFD